jgi:hypothetical protein
MPKHFSQLLPSDNEMAVVRLVQFDCEEQSYQGCKSAVGRSQYEHTVKLLFHIFGIEQMGFPYVLGGGERRNGIRSLQSLPPAALSDIAR